MVTLYVTNLFLFSKGLHMVLGGYLDMNTMPFVVMAWEPGYSITTRYKQNKK